MIPREGVESLFHLYIVVLKYYVIPREGVESGLTIKELDHEFAFNHVIPREGVESPI